MATEQIKVCDVYGTRKGVASYRVLVFAVDESGASCDEVIHHEVDLSARALARLSARIDAGVHPAGWKPEPIDPN